MYRMRLRRKKSAAALLKQKGDENFARLATSGLMVSSARRFGRRWVNKMYTAQVAKDKGMYLREMGEGVPRVEVQDPKMLFEFEKYLAVEQVPYHEQGDHMFYVDKVVKKREAVAQDELVQTCLGRLWDLVPKNGADGRHIAREDYINFHLCLQRVLFDPFSFTEAFRRAEDDWAVDILRQEGSYTVMPTLTSMGENAPQLVDGETLEKRGMSEAQFRGSMFEFADVWTDSVERMDYVRFLSVMLDRISLKKRAAVWQYFDKYAVVALDEPFRGYDAQGRDHRNWVSFPLELTTQIEKAFLAEAEVSTIEFRGNERNLVFLAEEIEQGVGLGAVPVRRVVTDEYVGHQPERKNNLSITSAAKLAGKMRLKARQAIAHVKEIKPFLQVAERSGNCKAPEWLLAKVDLDSDECRALALRSLDGGFYPLHVFTTKKDVAMVEYLLARGDDPCSIGPEGELLLQLAAEVGSSDLLQLLLRYPVDVNRRDAEGDTALHCAARKGHVDCVKLLLKHNPLLSQNIDGLQAGDPDLYDNFLAPETRTTITELIRECGTDQAEQEQRAREATDIKAAEEAATPEVYRRRSELLRSHSLKPESLAEAVAHARMVRLEEGPNRKMDERPSSSNIFRAAAQVHALEFRSQQTAELELQADLGNTALTFQDTVLLSSATDQVTGSTRGGNLRHGNLGSSSFHDRLTAAGVHQVLNVPQNCTLMEELEQNGLHLTRRLFSDPGARSTGHTGKGGQKSNDIDLFGRSLPPPKLRKFLLDELQSDTTGLVSAPWLSLLKYHPYFVFEDTSIGGPSLYLVNQPAARSVRRAFEENSVMEQTFVTNGGQSRHEFDSLASIAASFYLDPFDLWAANREAIEGYFIHNELPAGLQLTIPIHLQAFHVKDTALASTTSTHGVRYRQSASGRVPKAQQAFVDISGISCSTLSHQDFIQMLNSFGCSPRAVQLDLRSNTWSIHGRNLAMCEYILSCFELPAAHDVAMSSAMSSQGRCPYCSEFHAWSNPNDASNESKSQPYLQDFLCWHAGMTAREACKVGVSLRHRHHRTNSQSSYGDQFNEVNGRGHRRRTSRLHLPTDSSAGKTIQRSFSSSSRASVGTDASSDDTPASELLREERTLCLANVEHGHVRDILLLFEPIQHVTPLMITLDDSGKWLVLLSTQDEASRALRKLRIFGGDVDGVRLKSHHVQMLAQLRKEVALKKSKRKPSAAAFVENPTGVFHTERSQLRGLNVVHRELGSTSRKVNESNLHRRATPSLGVGSSSPLFQGRDKRPMRQEQRPSTAPGRLPVWRQRREHWQQKQRKKHRDQQLKLMRQQQKKQRQRQLEQEREQVPLSRLPEPRSPTRSSGTRSASASASPSARDRTSMPMLGREIDDAEAAEIVQAIEVQFAGHQNTDYPQRERQRPQTSQPRGGRQRLSQRQQWLRPSTAQTRLSASAEDRFRFVRSSDTAEKMVIFHDTDQIGAGSSIGGGGGGTNDLTFDRPETDSAVERKEGELPTSQSEHQARNSAGNNNNNDDLSVASLSTSTSEKLRGRGRGRRPGTSTAGRLFVGSAPLLPMSGKSSIAKGTAMVGLRYLLTV
eukprot:INCI5308.3.p1 GENE.INCI5308.3~~INCI5308.3.p1  ORF type:complete len:1637 (-),score=265.34 INCI5308.3:393-5129(-)